MISRSILLFVALIFSGFVHAQIDWNDKNIKWFGYSDGLVEAKKQGKNVVLVAYAEWCPTCKQYSKMFFDEAVIKSSNNVILVRVDVDKDKQTRYLKNFRGNYVPRTYILDSSFNIQPSPFKTKDGEFYLPPGKADYLAGLFKSLKK